jgi:hypothetical protein
VRSGFLIFDAGKQNDRFRAVRSVQHEEDAMECDAEDVDELTAACALCLNEDCGSLVISYRTAGERSSDMWDFMCSRCGLAFSVPEGELVFQSIAVEMLLAKLPHHHA